MPSWLKSKIKLKLTLVRNVTYSMNRYATKNTRSTCCLCWNVQLEKYVLVLFLHLLHQFAHVL